MRSELARHKLGVPDHFVGDTSFEFTESLSCSHTSAEQYTKLASSKASSDHSHLDSMVENSLHSIPEEREGHGRRQHRDNAMLRHLLGPPAGSLLNTSEHTAWTCPPSSAVDRELADLHIDSSRHSLQEEYLSGDDDLNDLRAESSRDPFRVAPPPSAQEDMYSSIDKDLEDLEMSHSCLAKAPGDLQSSRHSCVTAPVHPEPSPFKKYLNSSRHSLQDKALWNSLHSIPEQHNDRTDREAIKALQRENFLLQRQLGIPKEFGIDVNDQASSKTSSDERSPTETDSGDSLAVDTSPNSSLVLSEPSPFKKYLNSSRHSLQDKVLWKSLHSIPEQHNGRTDREAIEALQRENYLLQRQLGIPKEFRIDINDQVSSKTSSDERSPTETDSGDSLAIDTSPNSLAESLLGFDSVGSTNNNSPASVADSLPPSSALSSSLHSVPRRQGGRANGEIEMLQRENRLMHQLLGARNNSAWDGDGKHTASTSLQGHSSADIHRDDASRCLLQKSSHSLHSVPKLRSRRGARYDVTENLRRENTRLQQLLGLPKKRSLQTASLENSPTSLESEGSGNDTSPTALTDSLNWSSLQSIQERDHRFGTRSARHSENGQRIAENKHAATTLNSVLLRRASCEGGETARKDQFRRESMLRRHSDSRVTEEIEETFAIGGSGGGDEIAAHGASTGALLVDFGERERKNRRRTKRFLSHRTN